MAADLVRRALRARGLSPVERLVLVEYAERANAQHEAWGSFAKLADQLEVSVRSVRRAGRILERRGLMQKTEYGGGRGRSHVYLVFPKGVYGEHLSLNGKPGHGVPVSHETEPGNPDITPGFQGQNFVPKPGHRNPVITPPQHKETTARVRPAVGGAASRASTDNGLDPAAVQVWLASHPDLAAELRTEAAASLKALGRTGLNPADPDDITEKLVLRLASERMA